MLLLLQLLLLLLLPLLLLHAFYHVLIPGRFAPTLESFPLFSDECSEVPATLGFRLTAFDALRSTDCVQLTKKCTFDCSGTP